MQRPFETGKYWYLVGACLTIVGSFLPWETGGDPVPYWKPGIGASHLDLVAWLRGVYEFPWKDNGGLLVVLLTLALVLLVYGKRRFVRTPQRWAIICAASLVLISLYHAGYILWWRWKLDGIIGAPKITFGLIMVLVGSLLLVYISVASCRAQPSSRPSPSLH